MKLTGYRLQHAIREAMHLRDVLAGQFGDNIKQFASAPRHIDIQNVYQQYRSVEQQIAALQELQARYNLQVHVAVGRETMTLLKAIKLVGGAGRGEKMWRDASGTNGKRDRYRDDERSRDTEYAEPSVPIEICFENAREAHRFASSLREAIQVGNSTVLDLEVGSGLLAD